MKRITSVVVKSLVTMLIGSGTLRGNLQAQSDLSMTASIPFPFTVGTHSIPAGTYRFSLPSSPFLLSVFNVKNGHEQLYPVRPEQQRAFEPHGRLIFRNSEGRRALSRIYLPGTGTFSEVTIGTMSGRVEAKRFSTGDSTSVAQR
jgi:hypothetical protein